MCSQLRIKDRGKREEEEEEATMTREEKKKKNKEEEVMMGWESCRVSFEEFVIQ